MPIKEKAKRQQKVIPRRELEQNKSLLRTFSLSISSTKELKKQLKKYFQNTAIEEWTIHGLSLSLGLTRSKLLRYSKGEIDTHIDGGETFSELINKGKELIAYSYELDLKAKGNMGAVFALKQFGWVDKQELTTDNNIVITLKKYPEQDEDLIEPKSTHSL